MRLFPDLILFFLAKSSDSIDRYPISIEIATPLWNDNDAWTDQISYVCHMSVQWKKIGHPMREEFKVHKINGNDVKWLRFLIILISIVGAVYKTSFDFFFLLNFLLLIPKTVFLGGLNTDLIRTLEGNSSTFFLQQKAVIFVICNQCLECWMLIKIKLWIKKEKRRKIRTSFWKEKRPKRNKTKEKKNGA